MKSALTIFTALLLFITLSVKGQSDGNMDPRETHPDLSSTHPVTNANVDEFNNYLGLFLDGPNEIDESNIVVTIGDLESFVEKLKIKRTRIDNDHRFFNYLFYNTHRKFLKLYQSHTTVEDILRNGKYDCVSGTAFYTLILDRLGIDYEIKEFDFHVLVVAYSNNKKFLIESTDPTGGLVFDEATIQNRIEQYITKNDNPQEVLGIGANKSSYQRSYAINNNITLTELAGLQHFNNAVYYYNQKRPFETANSLKKSLSLYDCKRIREFQQLAIRSFLGDANLTQIQKEQIIIQFGLEVMALK